MKKVFGISLALIAAFAIVYVAFRPGPETPTTQGTSPGAYPSQASAHDLAQVQGEPAAYPETSTASPGESGRGTASGSTAFGDGAGTGEAKGRAGTDEAPGAGGTRTEQPSSASAVSVTWLDYFKEGNALYLKGEYETACAAFQKALEMERDSYYLHYMLGLAYWKDGRHERAAEQLNTCLELKPDHTKAWVNLARVRKELGDPQEAIALCEKALTLDEACDDAWNVTGLAYLEMNEREKARECFTNAIALDGKNAYALNNLALTFIYEERYGDAVLPLEQAVEFAPQVPFIHNNLGVVYEHLGRNADAAREYAAAADLPSGHAKAEASLKRILPLLSVEEEAKLAEFYQRDQN